MFGQVLPKPHMSVGQLASSKQKERSIKRLEKKDLCWRFLTCFHSSLWSYSHKYGVPAHWMLFDPLDYNQHLFAYAWSFACLPNVSLQPLRPCTYTKHSNVTWQCLSWVTGAIYVQHSFLKLCTYYLFFLTFLFSNVFFYSIQLNGNMSNL